jgi:hypothetical protein
MKSVIIILAAGSVALASAAAIAKSPSPDGSSRPSGAPQNAAGIVRPYGVAPWHRAASVNESWAIGRAILIESIGACDLYASIAANYWENARRSAMDNWAYGVHNWWQLHDEWRRRIRAEHPPMYAPRHDEINRQRDPQRLSPSQVSANGRIRWPSVLQAAELAEERERLEALFAEQARRSDRASELAGEIDREAVGLKKVVEKVEGENSLAAKSAEKFLDSLRLEARLRQREAGSSQLAAADRR